MKAANGSSPYIGDATRAAVLSLSKPYFFTIPLTFALVMAFGE